MKIYVVFTEKIYRHGCGGVFDSLDGAIRGARQNAKNDKDSHHWHRVYEYELNEIINPLANRSGYFPNTDFDDEKMVFETKK